jgi:hypothetical protein
LVVDPCQVPVCEVVVGLLDYCFGVGHLRLSGY